jgi:predicted O-methyltransferase YrrM
MISDPASSMSEKLRFAVECCQSLGSLKETPDSLRGYLAPIEGVALMLLAQHFPGEGTVVEIGSFLGKSTCWLALGAKAGERGLVHAVDWFKPLSHMAESEDATDRACVAAGSTFPLFESHVRRFGVHDQVRAMVMDSVSAAAAWPGTPIRLLFIDGHHEYESVKEDFESWQGYVPKGGLIAFHDYGPSWPGVVRFYDETIAASSDYEQVLQCRSLRVVAKR